MYEKPLSYSGLSLYRKCPRAWQDNYIHGNRRPSGAAAQRGVYLHELLEGYFDGSTPYPSSNKVLAPWQPYMEGLYELGAVAEGEVAVDSSWRPCGFDDPKALFRGKKDLDIEAGSTLFLFDWKSGKVYEDHIKQGKSYCALSPGYERYVVAFAYLDIPFLTMRWEFTAAEIEVYRAALDTEIQLVRMATEYPATPGSECYYCSLSWRNGGDCKRAP